MSGGIVMLMRAFFSPYGLYGVHCMGEIGR
jgi:hypothetical protein